MNTDTQPIGAGEFAAQMDRLGPFEAEPRLAVAVSGGSDSMALTLLAHAWAGTRGGRVFAVTVDHRLRPAAAEEAAQVGRWLTARGIDHAILRWTDPKPSSGIQEAARAARYRLLTEWCRGEGVLHLALAHNREDQAETVLLRFARGSGIDGLAGMAAVREAGPVRLLRPVLDMPRARLAATCRAAGQDWIDDPSNRNDAFARVRLRAAARVLSGEGLSVDRLSDTARRAGRARVALEAATTAFLARAATIFPEGYLRLDRGALAGVPEEIGLRAVARCLQVVGGAPYAPRLERLERLYVSLREGRTPGRTLGGCRVVAQGSALLIAREVVAAGERLPISAGGTTWWDRRFIVGLRRAPTDEPLTVARLGADGWAAVVAEAPAVRESPVPAPVRPALPAFWHAHGVVAVPHLAFARAGTEATARFTPADPLGAPSFGVV